jgi:death-on-curing protein
MADVQYVDLGDYLVWASEITGIPLEVLAETDRIALAASGLMSPWPVFGLDKYPSLLEKAAVLCWRLVKNHPLPDGNKRTAFLCMADFLDRNACELVDPAVDETVEILRGIADNVISEEAFTVWLKQYVVCPQ